ncbi:PAS domain S-box protein [Benzoatithermus flavus]|uniref:histidine kinase n=1 Tax=Benzoatithermus flavus TaxID=3108223 RepID=A0ABU8XSH1_9PROT
MSAPNRPVWSSERLLLGVALVLLLLCIGAGLGYRQQMRGVLASTAQMRIADQRAEALEQVLASLRDAETGQRGFLLTGRADYLDPYHQAVQQLEGRLTVLRQLYADEPARRQELRAIEEDVHAKLAELAESIRLRQTGGLAAVQATMLEDRGRAIMDRLRTGIGELLAYERARTQAELRTTRERAERTMTIWMLGTPLAGTVLSACLALVVRDMRRRAALNAELARAAAEERDFTASLFQAQGALVLVLDADGTIVRWNAACERLTGYTAEEALGRKLRDLLVPPEAIEAERLDFVRSPGTDSANAGTSELIARDGSRRIVEWSTTAVRSPRGEVRYVIATGIDVTERQHAQAALAASEGRFRELAEAMPHIVFIADAEGRIAFVNRRWHEFSGPDTARVFSEGLMALVHPEDRAMMDQRWADALARGERWHATCRLRAEDGSYRRFMFRAQPMRDPADESTVRWFGTATDVENLIRTQTALHEAEQASEQKTRFLATMSHEIRTPMTAVLGTADLLAGTPLDARQQQYLDNIRRSGQLLLAIIDDILDFMRFGSTNFQLERVDFSLGQVLEQVRSSMQVKASEKEIGLTFHVPEGSPPVLRGDPRRLEQILFNLVGNAIKFTERGGVTLDVTTQPTDDGRIRLRCEVRDTGIGISKEEQTRLFKAFSQANEATTRRFGGTGLGLAICKQLVEAMGGTIGVESQPGEGSTFWFEVILERGDAVVARAMTTGLDELPSLRILVAEDAPLNRELIGDMLRRHGHEVVLTENGRECLERAAAERFDLLLLDIQMPVMDGEQAIRQLRATPGPNQATPAIALTANVVEADRRRYLAAGMNLCLSKPIAWAKLSAAMSELADAGGQPAAEVLRATGSAVDWGFVAEVFAGMPEQIASYLGRALLDARGVAAELREARHDLPRAARLAHRLKGTARSFGLVAIADRAEEIEKAAKTEQDLGKPLQALDEALDTTARALEMAPGASA